MGLSFKGHCRERVGALSDHAKAAIDDRVKSGHREKA
jgi:hypothetical protein